MKQSLWTLHAKQYWDFHHAACFKKEALSASKIDLSQDVMVEQQYRKECGQVNERKAKSFSG
jgi:hypothetical protein